MTPRWRTTLRLRALLRLLLEKHVPMGTLDELVAFVASFSDSVLVDEQRRCGGSEQTGHSVPRLARDLSMALIDENLGPDALDADAFEDLRRVFDEVKRRRDAAAQAWPGSPVLQVFDELAAFVGRKLDDARDDEAAMNGRARLDEWLAGSEFYGLMQDYRLANIVPQAEVSRAFEAVKAAIRKAAP